MSGEALAPDKTIRRFKWRFVFTAMIMVGVISLVAFSIIAVTAYQQAKGSTDAALERAVSAESIDSYNLPSLGFSDGDDGEKTGTWSSVPVYIVSVYFDSPSSIVINQQSTATMSEEMSKNVVAEVLARVGNGEFSGELTDVGLYYRVNKTSQGYRMAFADVSLVMEEFGARVITLVGLWLVLMLAFFGVSVLLARYVARPIERAWRDQQRFIADASHELKTPLTIILADASILRDNPDKTVGEQNVWVEGISAEAERMKDLTEGMLALAQADAGVDRTQELAARVDLSSLVESQVLQFDAVAFERSLVIEDSVEEGIAVAGDEMRLENLVKTLLENACKYAEQPSTVEVRLVRQKANAVLTVANTGPTIPAQDLPHLFDRFYRSDRARANEGETASFGLGLSIAKSTVEMHDGHIAVASADGKTTFTVKLPLMR